MGAAILIVAILIKSAAVDKILAGAGNDVHRS